MHILGVSSGPRESHTRSTGRSATYPCIREKEVYPVVEWTLILYPRPFSHAYLNQSDGSPGLLPKYSLMFCFIFQFHHYKMVVLVLKALHTSHIQTQTGSLGQSVAAGELHSDKNTCRGLKLSTKYTE